MNNYGTLKPCILVSIPIPLSILLHVHFCILPRWPWNFVAYKTDFQKPGDQVKPEAHALVLTAKNARKKQEELTALKEMHEQIFNKEKKAKLQKKINYVQIELNRVSFNTISFL